MSNDMSGCMSNILMAFRRFDVKKDASYASIFCQLIQDKSIDMKRRERHALLASYGTHDGRSSSSIKCINVGPLKQGAMDGFVVAIEGGAV